MRIFDDIVVEAQTARDLGVTIGEFGAELVMKPGAQKMISVISRGILSDRELRRSALIIADRFSSGEKKQVVVIRGKTKING